MEKGKGSNVATGLQKIELEEDSTLAIDIDDPRQDDLLPGSSGSSQSPHKSAINTEQASPARKHNVLEANEGDADREPWEESPLTTAKWYQRLLFSQIDPIIWLGAKRQLQPDDMWAVDKPLEAEMLYSKFIVKWEEEVANWRTKVDDPNLPEKKKPIRPSLYRVFVSLFKVDIIIMGALQLTFAACSIGGPLVLREIVNFLTDPTISMQTGYIYAALYGLLPLIGTLAQGHAFLRGFRLGMKVRALMTLSVFRKSLRLNSSIRQDPTMSQGRITNLMSIDAQAFIEAIPMLHSLWVSPLTICVIIGLLYEILGPSCFAGVAVMVLLFPICGSLAKMMMTCTQVLKRHTDMRVGILTEILQGIRVIKLNAWEDSFSEKVGLVREDEMNVTRNLAIYKAINTFFLLSLPVFVSIITFTVYTATGNTVQANVVFPAIALFATLRFPLAFLPMIIAGAAKMNVARTRITKFLIADEIADDLAVEYNRVDGAMVGINNGTFYWVSEMQETQDAQDKLKKKGRTEKGKQRKASAVDGGGLESNDQIMPVTEGSKERIGVASKGDIDSVGDIQESRISKFAPTNHTQHGFELRDLNVKIQPGELIAVVGAVGSGKSSFLAALIGDMSCAEGSVFVNGSVAYAAQQAWILNGTLKDNVVFGKEFDQERYDQTIESCALRRDLEILPGGDQVEIGERGINLSGGQKQRISVARAVYNDADVVLLDDPLSAVDAHVGKHMFEKAILQQLAGKTRVLVTNQLHVLPHCDRVCVFKNNTIAELGTFEELVGNEQGEMRKLLDVYGHANEEKELEKDESDFNDSDSLRSVDLVDTKAAAKKSAAAAGPGEDAKQLIGDEDRQEGVVHLGVYWSWLQCAGGLLFVIAIFLLISSGQTFQVLTDLWLTVWTSNEMGRPDAAFQGYGTWGYLGIYSALGLLTQTIIFARNLTFALGGIRSSKRLHKNLIAGVFRKKTSFFDTTPVGRILNRFSKDTDQIDQYLPTTFEHWMGTMASVVSILVLICVVFPWFLVAFFPIIILYLVLQQFYRRSSREIQRLESTSRSPIYQHFNETLSGVATIRSYKQQDRFIAFNRRMVNINNRSYNILQIGNRWLQLRLELLGLVVMLCASFFSVTGRDNDLNPSLSGLVLTYALSVVSVMNWAVRMATETETKMTSVERVKEYSTLDDAEASVQTDDTAKPPANWPSSGAFTMNNLCMRYADDLPLALDNVSINVPAGSKVGVVGRTGSGKSSMVVSLFRMVEAAGGTICVDGIDISTLGLKDLRGRIGIIPQDPVLFSQQLGGNESVFGSVGGIKFNLDPEGKFTDEELWEALEHAQMAEFVRSLPNGLDAQVSENGENFSVGQRQLICLARALLKKPKLLVLDEATANVDVDTDMLIQRTIRTYLSDVTCLTIAHRLHTIMDADMVIVMDAGHVVENGKPSDLIDLPGGQLASLIAETGPKSEEKLKRIARGEESVVPDDMEVGMAKRRMSEASAQDSIHSHTTSSNSSRRNSTSHSRTHSHTPSHIDTSTQLDPVVVINIDNTDIDSGGVENPLRMPSEEDLLQEGDALTTGTQVGASLGFTANDDDILSVASLAIY